MRIPVGGAGGASSSDSSSAIGSRAGLGGVGKFSLALTNKSSSPRAAATSSSSSSSSVGSRIVDGVTSAVARMKKDVANLKDQPQVGLGSVVSHSVGKGVKDGSKQAVKTSLSGSGLGAGVRKGLVTTAKSSWSNFVKATVEGVEVREVNTARSDVDEPSPGDDLGSRLENHYRDKYLASKSHSPFKGAAIKGAKSGAKQSAAKAFSGAAKGFVTGQSSAKDAVDKALGTIVKSAGKQAVKDAIKSPFKRP